MATPKDLRGGRRIRRFAKKENLGAIDSEAISNLLVKLAPDVEEQRRDFALAIVVKGIELYREHAPSARALTGTAQQAERALEKFKKGKTAAGIVPFNSFAKAPWGECVGATDTGLYILGGNDAGGDWPDVYAGLEGAIAKPLQDLSVRYQRANGVENIDPNIPFNPPAGISTVADVLLDEAVKPSRDWDAELGGYVYLAITHGLSIKPITSWYERAPSVMRKGWNVGRLLEVAAIQAGAALPSSRGGMQELMARGKVCAEKMLAPAVTFADGRTISLFEMEFPNR